MPKLIPNSLIAENWSKATSRKRKKRRIISKYISLTVDLFGRNKTESWMRRNEYNDNQCMN